MNSNTARAHSEKSFTVKGFSPFLFCLCGPSGVGKSTISRELLKQDAKLSLSISSTTRPPRAGEVEGVHYYFVSEERFKSDIDASSFLEWAVYNNQYYGTPSSNYQNAKASEVDLLLDIDVQGGQKLKNLLGEKVIVIYIAPSSFEELKNRLTGRGSESEEVVAKRLKRAEEEIQILSGPTLTDHTVVNSDLSKAVLQVRDIIDRVRGTR